MQSPEEKNAFGKLQSIFNRSDRKQNVRLSFQSAPNNGLDKVPLLDSKYIRQSQQVVSSSGGEEQLVPFKHPKFSRNNKKDI
jgi:hypothetical protein